MFLLRNAIRLREVEKTGVMRLTLSLCTFLVAVINKSPNGFEPAQEVSVILQIKPGLQKWKQALVYSTLFNKTMESFPKLFIKVSVD